MPIKITLIFFKSYSSENNYYQKKGDSKCWQVCVGKGTSYSLLVGVSTGTAIVEINGKFFKHLKIELPYNPAIQFLSMNPEDPIPYKTYICTSVFVWLCLQ